MDEVCYKCDAGEYSGSEDCEPCTPGYICLDETVAKYPTDIAAHHGY
jgi:hypothetical protein